MIFFSKIKLNNKQSVALAFRKVYGIGHYKSKKISVYLGLLGNTKVQYINNKYLYSILDTIEINLKSYFGSTSLELQQNIYYNIKFLIENGSHKGFRHKNGLPVHGQRTRCNGSTQYRLYKRRLEIIK